MTLQNLKYVVAVAEHGSFSAAAKALYISQSTLSSAIKELEAELGTQLFLRSNRGIQPTPDGEDFLRYAREIVEQSRALERRYRHRICAYTVRGFDPAASLCRPGIPEIYGAALLEQL